MKIENISTFERCIVEGFNLFVGAGFSVLSSDKKGRTLPVGDDLRKELVKIFPGSPDTLQLPQLCTLLSRSKKDELETYIKSRFNIGTYDDKYRYLASTNVKNIFTTNVDNLLEKIFKNNPNRYLNNASWNGASIKDKMAVDCYYLHGNVTDYESRLVFGDLDIASAFSNDPNRWNYLKSLMNKFPTVFWGYALKDAGTLQVFSDAIDDNNRKNSWIIVHPDFITEGEIDYYKSLNLKIISSDTESFLKYLTKYDKPHTPSSIEYKNPFPEHSVPSHENVKHRSLKEFYQGATPSWSDIYSPRVSKIRYYSEAEEQINRGRNILITGGPATGKTTLLMQVAAFHEFNGIKLFLYDLSTAKARTLSAKIGDSPALLFVDNLQTSIDGLNILSMKSNIKLVIAERDYAYLSASRANFLRRKIEIIDITELNENDAQEVIENIPVDIKSNRKYKLKDGDSLFELIERNCRTPNIKERFNNVLNGLREKDLKLVDLFLLSCYLHTCRSVTSMDVIYSYFNLNFNDYKQLYTLISILSSSMSEYVGEFAEEEQDYFSIRSNLLAEHISTIAPSKDLNRVLTNFHNNVPRYSIPNYNAFKRQAYDARIFERAFPDTKEGQKIYDVIYRKHNSPFNLQQKALYLSRRKNYQRAFEVIDEAIAKSGSRNWSIKNSYAIIKFKANIDSPDSTHVRKALDESMEALEQCHSADIRKAFHAMSYADHSLKYWRKYRDDQAVYYLSKSEKWLSEEADRDNRIRNVSRLLMQVKRALQSAQ